MFRKILLGLSILLIICSCSYIENSNKVLDKDKIVLNLYFHKYDRLKLNDHDVWLLACYTQSYDDIYFDNVSIEGYDELGIVDRELSNDSTYTSDYCDDKILIEDGNPINIQYFIIQSNLDLYKEATKVNIKAIVTYNHQDYNVRAMTIANF